MKNIMKHAAYAFFFMAVAVFSQTGQAQDHWQCHNEDCDRLSLIEQMESEGATVVQINEAIICQRLAPTNDYYENVLRPQLIAKGLIEPCERH